ncbi:hypothetical protein J4222_04470 [Candidatus Woesearchaeota archaeon]|nr:hypothetical protein [Candidatus Woesearchaeota archaeon]
MTERVEKLLEQIKSLMILQMSKSNIKSEEIGKVLGTDGSNIRHILAGTKHKRNRK